MSNPDQPTKDKDKPTPRPPKSTAHAAQIKVQNRRREYLDRHPLYFANLEHELADPALYERLVRRHQSPQERQAERRANGYGRTLEADLLLRGGVEADQSTPRDDSPRPTTSAAAAAAGGLAAVWDRPAESRAHGLALWRAFLTHRFVRGDDTEFDYAVVDADDAYDGLVRRDAEERWFEDEEPARADAAALLEGETGVQDF